MTIRSIWDKFMDRYRYGFCCLLSALASLLGIINPILSSFIVSNILNNFNLAGIIPSLIAMAVVKGLRMFLRSRVNLNLKGNMRAPLIWLQSRIGKKLWWVEPIIGSWGWVGVIMTRITGGVSAQAASFLASFVTDTINTLAAGIVYYFSRNYILSLLTALILPTLAVSPWFAGKALRLHHLSNQVELR